MIKSKNDDQSLTMALASALAISAAIISTTPSMTTAMTMPTTQQPSNTHYSSSPSNPELNNAQKEALANLFTPELQTLCRVFSNYNSDGLKEEEGYKGREKEEEGGGYSIRVVGGACRDALFLGDIDDDRSNEEEDNENKRAGSSPSISDDGTPADIDLVTDCPPEIMPLVCESAQLRYKQLQGDHRTQTTLLVWVPLSSSGEGGKEEEIFELSSFRYDYHPIDDEHGRDGEDESSQKKQKLNHEMTREDDCDQNPWKIDASYRDFTMNAISCSHSSLPPFFKIHDYFGGIEDIQNYKVVWIGSPKTRLRESPVRCLRYFRFHGELMNKKKKIPTGSSTRKTGWQSLHDKEVLNEMAQEKERLKAVPFEAVWKNMKQILSSHENVVPDELQIMADCGFLGEILPPSLHVKDDFSWNMASVVRKRQARATNGGCTSSFDPILTIAALLKWNAENCEILGRHWLWSTKELQLASFLCGALYPPSSCNPNNNSENTSIDNNQINDDDGSEEQSNLFIESMSLEECRIRLRKEDRLSPQVTPSRDALKQVLIAQNKHDDVQLIDKLDVPVFPVQVKDLMKHAKKTPGIEKPVRNEIGEAIKFMKEEWIKGGCNVLKDDLLEAWSSSVQEKRT